jgi:aminoglycoside 6'-N-acetyltransferase
VILAGDRVTLRGARSEDIRRLAEILSEPAVSSRWGVFTDDEIAEQFMADTAFVVTVDDEVIGAIQYGENDDPMYRSANIDVFLTTDRHGLGLGSDAVRTLARYLVRELGHHRLTIDPSSDNTAAIRAYERVGFRRIGVMRQYERGPDGTWHDGLLMEMLADELTGGSPRRDPSG